MLKAFFHLLTLTMEIRISEVRVFSSFFYILVFQEKLMGHLGVVLYEYLGEEYPEVLGSILGALKVRMYNFYLFFIST